MSSEAHDELVRRAARWLSGTMRCCPVVTEASVGSGFEQPDAFGISCGGTILVECKISVDDFRADGQKFARKFPAQGMGRYRYYLTPPGLLGPDLLAKRPGWGLIEMRPKTIRVVRKSDLFEQSGNAEAQLFRSAWINNRLDAHQRAQDVPTRADPEACGLTPEASTAQPGKAST